MALCFLSLVDCDTYRYSSKTKHLKWQLAALCIASFVDPPAALSSFVLWLDGSQDSFNLGWATMSPFFRGLKLKVHETSTSYFTDDLSELLSVLFSVLLRLLMCWMSCRICCHLFLYYLCFFFCWVPPPSDLGAKSTSDDCCGPPVADVTCVMPCTWVTLAWHFHILWNIHLIFSNKFLHSWLQAAPTKPSSACSACFLCRIMLMW